MFISPIYVIHVRYVQCLHLQGRSQFPPSDSKRLKPQVSIPASPGSFRPPSEDRLYLLPLLLMAFFSLQIPFQFWWKNMWTVQGFITCSSPKKCQDSDARFELFSESLQRLSYQVKCGLSGPLASDSGNSSWRVDGSTPWYSESITIKAGKSMKNGQFSGFPTCFSSGMNDLNAAKIALKLIVGANQVQRQEDRQLAQHQQMVRHPPSRACL